MNKQVIFEATTTTKDDGIYATGWDVRHMVKVTTDEYNQTVTYYRNSVIVGSHCYGVGSKNAQKDIASIKERYASWTIKVDTTAMPTTA